MTPDEVKVVQQRWLDEAGTAVESVERFTKWLVANRYVTEYQANLVARGLPDNFFLNQYKILERLGQGGMAGVYKATHSLGQVVAIKVLPPSRAKDPRLFGRFQREARLALRLKHPNIVRAFQIAQCNGLHFIVMEYLEGETLDEVLKRRGKLPPAEAVRLIYQALMGLQHIHEQGLVHRDLKPSNLMLVPAALPGMPDNTLQATVKILDIGLGRALFDESVADDGDEGLLTGEGVLLGTPDYLAPEQARDAHAADIRADIYSLGCVLYRCLAGRPPFPDTNVMAQMVRHLTEAPRPLKEFNPAVPDGLQQIVNWMIAKDPAKRYPTPERAAQALQVFLVAGAGPLRTPEGDPKTRLFLTWLEASGDGTEDAPAEAPAAAPAAASAPAPAPAPKPVAAGATNPPAAKPAPATAPAPAPKPIATTVPPPAAKPLPAGRATPPAPNPNPGMPAGKLVGASPASSRHPPGSSRAKKRRTKKHEGRSSRPQPIPAAAPRAVESAEMFDVELVSFVPPAPAVRAAAAAPTAGLPFRLTRRDLLMAGLGAGGVAAAIGLGFLMAWVVRLIAG